MPTILPVPHILQTKPSDCLAACTAMVLHYWGKPIPYEKLLTLLNINWFGAPFSNLIRLEQLGATILYEQGSIADIHHHLKNGQPVIVPVFTGELPYTNEATNHAIVVVGIDSNYIYAHDPAIRTAPIPILQADFDLAWLDRDEWYAVIES